MQPTKNLVCLDIKTGDSIDIIPTGTEWGGTTIFADGMICLYSATGKCMLVGLKPVLNFIKTFRAK